MGNKRSSDDDTFTQLEALSSGTEAAAVAEIAKAAERPHVVEEGRKFKTIAYRGELHQVCIDPPAREHLAESVDALIALATDASVVWHSGDKTVLVMDNGPDSARDDATSWGLTTTAAWRAAIRGLTRVSQKDAIALLTGALRKPVREGPAAKKLLDSLRTTKFSVRSESTGTVDKVAEACGKSVTAELADATDLPEEITVRVRRWAELDHEASVELVVTVDAMAGLFTIAPTVDEAKTVELNAQAALADYLRERLDAAGKKGVPVFAGQP